ncbi:MAG: hypothetical protein ACODAU_09500, partial [Myxococcota bacterium]
PDDAQCDDGISCTTDSCDASGACENTPDDGACDDGNECTANTCDPATGCETTDVSDGTTCDGGAGECVAGSCEPFECTGDGDCTETNECLTGACVDNSCEYTPDDAQCDDGISCTTDSCDASGACENTPDDGACDDGNECTVNTCDAADGCQTSNVADGTACTTGGGDDGTCQSGVCEVAEEQRVFRMSSLELVDPHVVLDKTISYPFGSCDLCGDITNDPYSTSCAGMDLDVPAINPELNNLISNDDDGDGYLDLSFMLAFDPLDQTDAGGGMLTVTEGLCTDPTTCEPDPDSTNTSTSSYTTQASGTCLDAISGTTDFTPNSVTGSCFVSDPTTFTLSLDFDLMGETHTINVVLEEAQVAGEWVDDPATDIATGLIRGFLPMQTADQEDLTVNVDLVGDVNMNLGRDLIPDGGGNHGCDGVSRSFPSGGSDGANAHCEGGDMRDLRDSGSGASYTNCGWWFYIDYTAEWVENATGF